MDISFRDRALDYMRYCYMPFWIYIFRSIKNFFFVSFLVDWVILFLFFNFDIESALRYVFLYYYNNFIFFLIFCGYDVFDLVVNEISDLFFVKYINLIASYLFFWIEFLVFYWNKLFNLYLDFNLMNFLLGILPTPLRVIIVFVYDVLAKLIGWIWYYIKSVYQAIELIRTERERIRKSIERERAREHKKYMRRVRREKAAREKAKRGYEENKRKYEESKGRWGVFK
jgi:hypothetical protein